MSFEQTNLEALNYFPCRYGTSRIVFRGPRRRLSGDYAAYLGGIETFGKFAQMPYPTLVEHTTGLKSVNLGCANVGIDTYLTDKSLLVIAQRASATVIEVMGAQNMSNRYYAVHPRRNDRLIRASSALKSLFPEIDYTEFSFVNHLLVTLLQQDAARFVWIERELKVNWLARMIELIENIDGPVVLLWLADHETGLGLEGEPLLVDQSMMTRVADHVDNVVSVIATEEERNQGHDELVFGPLEQAAADELMGPVVHRRVAKALASALQELT